jgi:hypothetical protein
LTNLFENPSAPSANAAALLDYNGQQSNRPSKDLTALLKGLLGNNLAWPSRVAIAESTDAGA